MLKKYIIQLTAESELQFEKLPGVDYQELLKTMHFPLLWVYERYLQAWLPREVDSIFLAKLVTVTGMIDLRFERRLQLLSLYEVPLTTWEELQATMARNGVVKAPGILPPGFCSLLAAYYARQPEHHDRWQDLPGIKRTSVNDSPLMKLVHAATLRLVRYVVGDVKPSYVFTSAYEAGTTLPRHTDRPECVFNMSVILGSDPTNAALETWPLHIEVEQIKHAVSLEVGDGVLYSGVKDPHWRAELPAEITGVLGAFFHYVPYSQA